MPNKPSISASSTSSEISLSITRPEGGVDEYRVVCYSPSDLIVTDQNISNIEAETIVTASMLAPYTEYRCVVAAKLGTYDNGAMVTVATQQAG